MDAAIFLRRPVQGSGRTDRWNAAPFGESAAAFDLGREMGLY